MGRALALQGQYEPAIEQFNLITHARPNDPAPYVSIGDARLRQRRVDEAIASYESALRRRPGDPDILGQLGLALGAAGSPRGAAPAVRGGAGGASQRPPAVELVGTLAGSGGTLYRSGDAHAPHRGAGALGPDGR